MEIQRHLFAIIAGMIGGIIPNNKSNIHPFLMGCILAILGTKVIFGDYDSGYQWSLSDFLFVLIVGGEGALGAYLSSLVV